MEIDMTKAEEIIDNIARLNSQTWEDREEVRTKIGRLLSELKKALEQQPSEHITCKCCKYWIEEKHRKDDLGVCVCFSKAHVTCHLPKDFYCKFAERKEEE